VTGVDVAALRKLYDEQTEFPEPLSRTRYLAALLEAAPALLDAAAALNRVEALCDHIDATYREPYRDIPVSVVRAALAAAPAEQPPAVLPETHAEIVKLARNYWQWGNEPLAQALLTYLIQWIEAPAEQREASQ
jgi:hypothetical protein